MIRVADYIAGQLASCGVKRVFMITGGGAMHLNDAFGKCKKLECVFFHHEQACAIAAEGHSRITGKLSAVNVTTGPGGLNTLTGVMGQWTDSVPVIYISGQVKFETTIACCPSVPLRQLGDQEVDIISVVRPLVKFAASIRDPYDAGRLLDEAVLAATSGRPGPVWLDVPMNVQGAMVDPAKMRRAKKEKKPLFDKRKAAAAAAKAARLLMKAKRPVIVGGNGVRVSGAAGDYLRLIERLGIPALATLNAFDLVPTGHKLAIGRIGTIGDRAGNFALQNADFVLFIGTRNNIRQISYGWKTYARAAFTVGVDIDGAELRKPTFSPALPVHSDAGFFIRELARHVPARVSGKWGAWLDWCAVRRARYPTVPALPDAVAVDPYLFIRTLTRMSRARTPIVCGNGTACVAGFQAIYAHPGQRVICNSGCASMGYCLPASIGACIASGRRDTICLSGDGSIMMNLQELQTIAFHKLPIKIFLLNNGGYSSIRQTQLSFFGKPYVGCGETSGVGFPDFTKVGAAFGLKTEVIGRNAGLEKAIASVLALKGPVLCDVRLEKHYSFAPKLSSERKPDGRIISKPLEDMTPLLGREEFKSNMIVEPLEQEGGGCLNPGN